jgi:two-component system, NtrC family, nitrogen regulation sensor histidine kinase NtrY
MTPTSPPDFSRSAWGWAVGLAAAAAASAAGLTSSGVGPFAATALAAGVFGGAAWLSMVRLGAAAERQAAAQLEALRTERDRVRGREEVLRSVWEASPMALLFYSDAGRILLANDEARRLFFEGASPEGQNFLRIVAQAPEALRRALLGDSDELFSVELDGHRETYHVSRRSFDFDRETHTLLLVRHLTFEVSRREVEVLKRVIRIISHEMNNSLAPIASLIHSARVIAGNPEHLPKLARVFDTIEERAGHLATFLNGYATLARLPQPRRAAVPLAPMFARLAALHPSARIADPGAATAWCDAAQLEQVLINLLKNAEEAEGPAEAVEVTASPEADGAVSMEVSDRGKGLTPEALESAFLPLYSTKERGGGMGLALCREIVEAHGGRVSIRNREGGGCTASLWLPPERKRGAQGTTSRARLTLTHS